MQCDIFKYFPSIDHAILKVILRRKIKCPDTLWLIDTLVDASNPQEEAHFYFPGDTMYTPFERRRGLPIGNLTSQFFANEYLNGFDHYVKERLKAEKYIRFVDDFALFSEDLEFLRANMPGGHSPVREATPSENQTSSGGLVVYAKGCRGQNKFVTFDTNSLPRE